VYSLTVGLEVAFVRIPNKLSERNIARNAVDSGLVATPWKPLEGSAAFNT
jgi:hypothetical protein